MKQTGIYLILGGAVVFILVFMGKIIALIFNNPLLGLALMSVVLGVFVLLYSIIQEEREKDDFKDIRPIHFDFGFMYAVNEHFRFGIHNQIPIVAFYWKF